MSFIREIVKGKEKQSRNQSVENESHCASVDITGIKYCISLAENFPYFQMYRYGKVLSKNKIDDKT